MTHLSACEWAGRAYFAFNSIRSTWRRRSAFRALRAVVMLAAFWLSDRTDRVRWLMVGTLLLGASQLCLWAGGIVMLGLGAVLWGLHMGFSHGLLSAMVADAAPADARGTAFGVFHLSSGVALLLASVIAGSLWDYAGAGATFLFGAALSLLATLGLRWTLR